MKILFWACLFAQLGLAATIRSGSFTLPLTGIFAGEDPTNLTIAGDGFSATIPLFSDVMGRPTERSPYGYGRTETIDFYIRSAPRYYSGLTSGFLFGGTTFTGPYLFGYNSTFGGNTPEDRLQQSPIIPSQLHVVASPLVFPNPRAEVPSGQGPLLTGTFELTGSLCGYLTGTGSFGQQPCVFDMPTVYGRGTYEVRALSGTYINNGDASYGYWNLDGKSFKFTFVDPGADIPEPGTMAMLAVGVAGVGLLRRAKHHAK